MRIKTITQQLKKLLIVKQILLVRSLGNVWGTVRRIPLPILRCKVLTPQSDRHLISPPLISSESNIEVTRIQEMITN